MYQYVINDNVITVNNLTDVLLFYGNHKSLNLHAYCELSQFTKINYCDWHMIELCDYILH